MAAQQDEDPFDFDWRVTGTTDEDGGKHVNLSFGGTWAESRLTDDSKVSMLGRVLIKLGTNLIGAEVGDEEGYDDE